jgi:hypothetical protein
MGMVALGLWAGIAGFRLLPLGADGEERKEA